MTKIFVFLTDSLSRAEYEDIEKALLNSSLSESVKEALRKKNEQAKRESVLTRALLFGAHLSLYGTKPPILEKTRLGAPYLKSGARISLSHTKGAVAVLLSDESPCGFGVDIEGGEVLRSRAERLEKRFLKGLCEGPDLSGVEIFLATLTDAKALSFAFSPLFATEPTDDFLAQFTRAEAILKCTGRGFGAASHLARLSSRLPTATVGIPNDGGTPFVLSYARRRRFFPLLKKPWR